MSKFAIALCGEITLLSAFLAAQTTVSRPVVVSVNGRAMRVIAEGLERRQPMQPVVILEAGAVGPGKSQLDEWTKALPSISAIAPVIAYERRGSGMSDADTEPPTMHRVAKVLHDLLAVMHVPPPYVLVGHSWGGNYIRAFTDLYPAEVAGLVFVDADTGTGPTRQEKAAVVPPEHRADVLKPPVLPPFPANTPPGQRAELEEVGKEMTSDGAEAKTFKPLPKIPIAVVVATPPGRMEGSSGLITRLMIEHALNLVLASPNSMLITADHVGHAVQNDDPALVTMMIKHVLDWPASRRRQ